MIIFKIYWRRRGEVICVYRCVYKGEMYYKNYFLLIYIYKKRIYHFKLIDKELQYLIIYFFFSLLIASFLYQVFSSIRSCMCARTLSACLDDRNQSLDDFCDDQTTTVFKESIGPYMPTYLTCFNGQ